MNLTQLSGFILSFVLLQAAIHSKALAATCYYRKNNEVKDPSIQPCDPSKEVSQCCALEKKNQGYNDTCLSNGLCYAEDGYYSGIFFESGCTDKTWGSPLCSSVCQKVPGK